MYFLIIFLLPLLQNVSAENYRYFSLSSDDQFEQRKCNDIPFDLGKAMKQVSCKPRSKLVELIPESPNIILYPQQVEIKQCSGVCYGFSSCFPIEKKKIPVPILKRDFMTGKRMCGILYVEEHTKCNCGCISTPSDCSDRQVYNSDQCRCVCKHGDLKACSKEKWSWNPDTCSCECTQKFHHCNFGTEWIPSLCRCAKVELNYSSNQSFDN